MQVVVVKTVLLKVYKGNPTTRTYMSTNNSRKVVSKMA